MASRDATGDLIDALIAHGSKVRTLGPDRWLVQCPAHPDGRPSLSIRRGRGQALLFCFAGCTADAVAASLGWVMGDLFNEPRGVDYEYKREGKTVRTVHRSPTKEFRQTIIEPGIVTLYTPPGLDLAQAVENGVEIYIPEGEKDADTLWLEGAAAVSAPMGAINWDKADYTVLRGRAPLTIVADKDDVGVERARALHRLLVTITSGPVRIVQAATGKDATDHLVAGRGLNEWVPVVADPEFEDAVEGTRRQYAIVREAKRRDQADTLNGQILNPMTLGALLDLPAHEYDWVVPELLERRDRLILTGPEGRGKSQLLRQIAICTAAGVHPLDMSMQTEPMKVLIVDAENTLDQWARNARFLTGRAAALGFADPRVNTVVQAGVRIDLTIPDQVNRIHKMIDQVKPDMLSIGPLYKLVPKEITTDDDAAPLIVALDSFRERGITLIMEAHTNHSEAGFDGSMRPRGSRALLGWPEFGLGLRPLEDDDTMMSIVRWRGDRDKRVWPRHIRYGIDGEFPWMPADY